MFPRKPFVRITVQVQAQQPQQSQEQPQQQPQLIDLNQLISTNQPFQLPSITELTRMCAPLQSRRARRFIQRRNPPPFGQEVSQFIHSKFDDKTDVGMAHILAATRFLRQNPTFCKDFDFMARNHRLDEDPKLVESFLRESRFGLRSLDITVAITKTPSKHERNFITYNLTNNTLIPKLQCFYQISDEDIEKINDFMKDFKCWAFFINTQHDEKSHFIRIFRILTVKFLYDPKYVK